MTMTVPTPMTGIDVSAFAPRPPRFRHEPQRIAEDTYVIKQTMGEGELPDFVYMNSMVILSKEPVIVDTGTVANRKQWLEDVFSLVDPKDVRWVFISHDDHDHVGNLAEVMALCPNARLVSSWFQVERLGGDLSLPLDRMIWLDDGQSFDVGDRVLAAIRPPVFDSPTTRGLYDPKTGVYWAVDAFATSISSAFNDVAEMHPEEWRQGFNTFNLAISPWIHLVDSVKFNKTVKRLADLRIGNIAAAHTPVVSGGYVGSAIDALYDLPGQPKPVLPGQAELDQLLKAIGAQH
jgi:flavorubredoxin